MQPDEPSDEERLEELPEDNGTPFRPADDDGQSSALDNTHPDTDTDIQPEELYDEGVSGAAEAEEPNRGNSVVGYTPPASGKNDEDENSPGEAGQPS